MNLQSDTIYAVGGAWKGDGIQGRKVTTAAEILRLSNLDFTVNEEPIFRMVNGAPVRIKGKKALVRSDNGQTLSVMSDKYGVLQPAVAASVLDPAAEQGSCIYTSAVSLDGGAKYAITALLPQEIRIGKNDLIKPYIAAINSFDGSTAALLKALSFRPICRNTFMRALRTEKDTQISVKHTANVASNYRAAMEAIRAAGYTFQKLGAQYQEMARQRFTDQDMARLSAALLPAANESEVPKQTESAREIMVVLFSEGAGQKEIADIRGTKWAAFNAVTEFVDHLRATRVRASSNEAEARLSSAWLGSGAQLKADAFEMLTAEA